MKRREFLQHTALLAGGLVLTGKAEALVGSNPSRSIKGKVTAKGKGIAGVVVSDGYTVVATDARGRYSFESHPQAEAVFISTPAGYHFLHQGHIARHYHLLTDGAPTTFNFNLEPLGRSDDEHQFIIWADPQVKNAKDVAKMMDEAVPDVQRFVVAAGAGTLLHGITVGDIVWDELQLFADYDKAVAKMGIPFFQCIGNHDMDYNQGGDEASDDTFVKTYGPTCYSFNRGQVHYVVMDDVRYLGKDRAYDGFFQQHQLQWLAKDLTFVPKDKLVVLCVHIPVHNGVANNKALYSLLEGRKVHIMSGHTHYLRNVENGNIYEHNHGTVCGAWWTGPICGDGTPCGYGVYTVKGTELQWQYQSTGKAAEHQMKIYMDESQPGHQKALVNVWNHDSAWKVTYAIDGQHQGAMAQTEGYDPQAFKTMLGPDLPKPRGFAEPNKTNHLFTAAIPAGAKQLQVFATDRFGRNYTETYML